MIKGVNWLIDTPLNKAGEVKRKENQRLICIVILPIKTNSLFRISKTKSLKN